jgi:hypothetical protein
MRDKRAFYASQVDPTEMRSVKHYLRAGGNIKEVVLVQPGHDLATVASQLDCDSKTRRERGLALAKAGVIRFAVEDPGAVAEPWKAFAVSFKQLPDDQRCRVIYAPPAYIVQEEGRSPTRTVAPEVKKRQGQGIDHGI